MLLPELNTPVGFAGKDGFYWWIGQVETDKDTKNSNRYKVRIVGQHLKSCEAIPYDDLPWATIMLPVTHPASLGNSNYTPAKLQKGDWVMGFFLDGASGQHPVIMGQMPRVTKSTKNDKLETSKSADACLGFSNYVPPTNPTMAMPAVGGAPAQEASTKPTGTNPPSTAVAASAGENNPGNPMGRYACHPIADAGCKDTGTAKTKMEEALTEVLGSISKNGGQIGTKMLSEASGQLFDYAAAGRGYVTRIFGVANAYLRNAKFRMIALIKQGVEKVVKWLMGIPTPPVGEKPKSGPVTKQKSVGFLGKLIQQLNDSLSKLNCQFVDFEQRLLDFLTNLITDLLTDVVNAATCVVEAVISQILSQIESFLTGIIDAVLGPLQSILGIIASPLNILGAALQYIFQLIGLSCTGPDNKCSDKTQHCTGTANKKKPGEDDFGKLDDLIASIESKGVTPLQTSCEEAYALPCPPITTAVPSGGTPGPGSSPGTPPLSPPPDPYQNIIPNLPNATPTPTPTPTPTQLFPPVNVTVNSFNTLNLFGRTNTTASLVANSSAGTSARNIFSNPSTGTLRLTGSSNVSFTAVPLTATVSLDFFLTSDKTRVTSGDNISFTLTVISGSVPDGTEYDYILFGTIQRGDFTNNSTAGKIRMVGGVGVVTLTIADALSITTDTLVTFALVGPNATTDFTIYTNITPSEDDVPNNFIPPTLCDPVVDKNGRIMHIPVCDPGDRYLSPPFIAIYGAGTGGFASPILDDTGLLTKVVVDRPGVGYTPTITTNDNCYIEGFVVIRPGYGYSSPPIVYVNGDPNVAQAVINENGNLISVKVINKIKTFDQFPTIEIVGGGGMGGKAIPSFNCIEPTLYEKYVVNVAAAGVDEVIDCPSGDCDDCKV